MIQTVAKFLKFDKNSQFENFLGGFQKNTNYGCLDRARSHDWWTNCSNPKCWIISITMAFDVETTAVIFETG